MQPMAVGQKATNIARFVGISVKPKTKLLIAPIKGVGRKYPLSAEKLFPVLAVYRAQVSRRSAESLRRREPCRRAGTHGGGLLQQRRRHPPVRRCHQCRAHHRELARVDRRAGRRLQRHGADVLIRLRHRRRQQHHRQRQRLSLPEHQAHGAKDTGAYVVPRSEPDLLQHECGGEPAQLRVALDPDHHQPGAGAAWTRGHCPSRDSARRRRCG